MCAKRLVVVPSDPIEAYENKGTSSWLEVYYNPRKFFDEVFALSPLESGRRQAYGMTIIGVHEKDFSHALNELRPDVVRAYGGYWPSDLVCRGRVSGIPVVVSVHDTKNVHPSVRYADIVICMSKVVQDMVLQLGTPIERTRIMPNRIDTTTFRPQTVGGDTSTVFDRFPPGRHLLHIGRRSEQKNIDTVIRALAYLPLDYTCVFVGQGDRTGFVKLADEVGVAERCYWIDSLNNSDLPLWYSWCDCFCVPSRWEGFGLVFLEAAACGAAIVTSNIAPMNEYLSHDCSACLVTAYEDPVRLAEVVRIVCEDADYRERIATGAVKAAQPFARECVDLSEIAIYQEAMGLGRLSMGRRTEIEVWRTWLDLLDRLANKRASVDRLLTKLHSVRRDILAGRWSVRR